MATTSAEVMTRGEAKCCTGMTSGRRRRRITPDWRLEPTKENEPGWKEGLRRQSVCVRCWF